MKLVVRLSVAALSLCALPSAADAALPVAFQTPSRNIRCYMDAGGSGTATCHVMSRACYNADSEGYFYATWRLYGRGKGHGPFCPGDTVPPSFTLQYGKSIRVRNKRCTSRKTGVTCIDNRTGHGFFVSRASQRVF